MGVPWGGHEKRRGNDLAAIRLHGTRRKASSFRWCLRQCLHLGVFRHEECEGGVVEAGSTVNQHVKAVKPRLQGIFSSFAHLYIICKFAEK